MSQALSPSALKTLAFFGATGDCTGFCLAAALNAGYRCTALARTPTKLESSLRAKGLSDEQVQQQLTIVQGDVRDFEAVRKTLVDRDGQVVDVVVSGVGGTPQLQLSLLQPVRLNDNTICQDAGATILRAAQSLSTATPTSAHPQPYFVNISTTGIPAPGMPRDVPLAYLALYKWFLSAPHDDKEILEENLRKQFDTASSAPDDISGNSRGFKFYINVKPTLLMSGPGVGVLKIRAGREDQPAIGYTIDRKDVGEWIFEKLIAESEVPGAWQNRSVTITA